MSEISKARERFVFIDGLRGIAAVLVVLHHLVFTTVLGSALSIGTPRIVGLLSVYGSHGVQIFFVISGFVIAHSLRNIEPTWKAIGNFIVRRQLRLDPPYWVTLAFVLILATIKNRVPGLVHETTYSPGQILTNMAYLQNATRSTQILGVAWTLCLEIQFYLVFIVILALARLIVGKATVGKVPKVAAGLVFALGMVSMACSANQVVDRPFFYPFWFYFASGVLCYWCLRARLNAGVFWAFAGLIAATTVWHAFTPHKPPAVVDSGVVCLVTIITLFLVGKAGHLTDWLGGQPFNYLGRISYSLYLVHFPVLDIVMRGGYKLTKDNPNAALGWASLALCCCVAVAHVLYTFVEAPSMRLASRFKDARRHQASEAPPEPLELDASGTIPSVL